MCFIRVTARKVERSPNVFKFTHNSLSATCGQEQGKIVCVMSLKEISFVILITKLLQSTEQAPLDVQYVTQKE